MLSSEFEVIYACSTDAALIKKKRKFSSYKRTYEEMRKYLVIYEEVVSHIWHCNFSLLNFLLYEENFLFFSSVQQENIDLRDGDKTAVYSCQSLSSTLVACLVNKTVKQN